MSNVAELEVEQSVEMAFAARGPVPSWKNQVTVRGLVVAFVLSTILTFIKIRISLTTEVVPSLNVCAGILSFFFVKVWTRYFGTLSFTRQENSVIQSAVVAASGIAFSGGFGSYMLGLSGRIARQSGEPGSHDFKNPSILWMIGFLLLVSFLGLLSLIPLRKVMIVGFGLTFPSATATGHLINSLHTPQGAQVAREQVKELGKFSGISFVWALIKWLFSKEQECGFAATPTFGLKAYLLKFYFDFSMIYVGVGMLSPHIINVSALLGGILSWGLMWPLIGRKRGDWYSPDLPTTSMHGLQAYKVFIPIAIILGDGLYNFVKVLSLSLIRLYRQRKSPPLPIAQADPENSDEQRRAQTFLGDQIPAWFAMAGYLAIAIISAGAIPLIFPHLKWYHVSVMYTVAPALAFSNSYGCGLTDWSLGSTYGKMAIFLVGAWAGDADGGVVAGLVACGIMMNVVSTATDLMQDLKTGYVTQALPRAVFTSQVIGTVMGCVVSPCVFWVYYKAFGDLGVDGSVYSAPFASAYRAMAQFGVEGWSVLPKNCLSLCYGFFAAAIMFNGARDLAGKKWSRMIPIPMAMAMPFYIGPYFAINMCLGSLILLAWERKNREKAEAFAPAVASGLISGEGLWSLPSSIIAFAGAKPPFCLRLKFN